jgi:hypothetical protein
MTISLYQQQEDYLGFLGGFVDVDLWLWASAAWSKTEGGVARTKQVEVIKKVIEYCDSEGGFLYVIDRKS